MSTDEIHNPIFARLWRLISAHEPESIRALRRENLDGLCGRVLEVGAGTGTNFEFYPPTTTEVVAVEPEPRLAAVAGTAAAAAPVPITVTRKPIEALEIDEPFDAVVCSLVLCSVADPDDVMRQLHAALKPGGELRYLEHVASAGTRGRLQRLADATLWPPLMGNCHTHRDTERVIAAAGFRAEWSRRDFLFPAWVPVPTAEYAIGRAVRSG